MATSKPHFPTTTAHAIRLCLFQATRRPAMREHVIETPWGKVRVRGKLGQQHADVLEAICYEREKKADLEDGRIKLLVDPARVRRRANQVSGSTFQRVLEELQMAVVEIIEPAKLACQGHLIDHIDMAVKLDGTPITRHDPLTCGERGLWRVELGKALCKLVAGDIWIGYDPALLSRIERGICQAVARHILSHKIAPTGGWTLDRLIQTVAGDLSEQDMRNRRRELRAGAAELAKVGITINVNRIIREQQ